MGPHRHPEVTLHTLPLADYAHCLESGDLRGVADLMLQSAEILAGAGADFLFCPDNTIHDAYAHVAPRSPLPWLPVPRVFTMWGVCEAMSIRCLVFPTP